jgi:hypothetical protein
MVTVSTSVQQASHMKMLSPPTHKHMLHTLTTTGDPAAVALPFTSKHLGRPPMRMVRSTPGMGTM